MINSRKLLGPRCAATSPTIQHRHPTTRESPSPPSKTDGIRNSHNRCARSKEAKGENRKKLSQLKK